MNNRTRQPQSGTLVIASLPADMRHRVEREMRYAATRKIEIGMSVIMMLTGIALLIPGETFSLPGHDFVEQFVAEDYAGLLAVVVGGARLTALYYNGTRRKTPLVRVVGAVGGFFFWVGISIGIVISTVGVMPVGFGLAIFPVFAWAEIHAGSVAAADIVILDSFGQRAAGRERAGQC